MTSENLLSLISILCPSLFAATAIASWLQPGLRPLFVRKMSQAVSIIGILVAVICCVLVFRYNLLESNLIGMAGLGLSIRLDALSTIMLLMIALLSFIVVRFSINYLDGDQRQGVFIGRLTATVASVQLLVLSGNLGLLFISWVLTSISLHRLLVFYKNRPGAIIAARKKYVMARLGDVCLLVVVVGLYYITGTGNLEQIFQSVNNQTIGIELIALFLAGAALLKSAQFPTHGWLVEVMETPTPVSALLHAGLLNAGPFLIIRMAFVMDASTYAPLVLIAIGGFTAIFASAAFLTQSSVKTALGYSSIAHMGFSLFVCGLGVYPAAMLHLVAHSFYKAHSFLSSGSVIELIRAAKVSIPKRVGNPLKIVFGMLLAGFVYFGFTLLLGIDPLKELSLLAIGLIIVMGLSRIFTLAIDTKMSPALFFRACILVILVAGAFFTLETGMHHILSSQVPVLVQPTLLETTFIAISVVLFFTVVCIQLLAPTLSTKPIYQAMAIHIRNGLYANALLDRWVRALYVEPSESNTKSYTPVESIRNNEPSKIERSKVQNHSTVEVSHA